MYEKFCIKTKRENFNLNSYDWSEIEPSILTPPTTLSTLFCLTIEIVSPLIIVFENKLIKSFQHWLFITLIPLSVYCFEKYNEYENVFLNMGSSILVSLKPVWFMVFGYSEYLSNSCCADLASPIGLWPIPRLKKVINLVF